MNDLMKKILLCFIAGCLGGIAVNVVNIILALVNIPHYIGVDLSQDSSIIALYMDLLWGGLWGILFLIPILENLLFVKGVLLSLIPTLFQLFVVLPKLYGVNILGLEFSILLPLYIFLLNGIWGIFAALFLSYSLNKA